MAEKLKKGDFIEIDYDGFVKEEKELLLFDSTDENKVKSAGAHDPKSHYGPIVICIGEHQVLPALDEALIGMSVGENKKIELPPEKSFGRKDAKMLKIVPMTVFKKEKIQPFPGLQISIDGTFGTVKTVSGGRVIIDFNHPLAGKDVVYHLMPRKLVTDVLEKTATFVSTALNIPRAVLGMKGDANDVEIKAPFKLPKEIEDKLFEAAQKLIPELKKITFVEVKLPQGGKDEFGRDPNHEHYGHHHG